MNRYAPHVYVIPEDDRDRQIADGFVLHHQVKDSRIQVVPPAGGWSKVLATFVKEYVPKLRDFKDAHVVMLIDFDDQVEGRKEQFAKEIPAEFQTRVFVVGAKRNPEALKSALKIGFEEIGRSLADDCDTDSTSYWSHEELRHNDVERQRLVQAVKPFLF